jgi:4-amino-4-deoxy-L-arabinose transferase-like glycosyltransferase
VAAFNGLLWMFTIPFQHGPDEGAHFQVVRFIRDYGRLPLFHPSELWLIRTQSGAVETYAAFPPLAYALAALAARPFADDTLWPARLTSLLSCLGAVAATFILARRLLPAAPIVAVTAGLTLALLPQFAFTAAYVNNDALPVFETAILYLLLLHAWRRGPSIPLYVGIGATVAALLLTKYTFYAAALVGFGAAAYVARDLRRHWAPIAALGLAVVAGAGWWFARNVQLYGELIPSRTIAAAKASAGGNTLFVPTDHGITLLTVSTQTDFWAVTLRSFVATFGFLSIYLDAPYYLASVIVAALGLIGLVVHVRRVGMSNDARALSVFFLALLGSSVLASMAISTYGEYSPQGRYLFGILVPTIIVLACGWYWLGPRHWFLRWLPGAAVAFMAMLSLVSLFGYVIPRDFSSRVERLIVELDRPSQPQSTTAEVEVLGWSFAQGAATWWPFSPDSVNRYRRPASGILIYLDGPPGRGEFQGTANYGFRRRDVSEFYGGNRRLDPIGYRFVFPPGTLPAGEHRLYACALAQTTEIPTCAERVVTVVGAEGELASSP